MSNRTLAEREGRGPFSEDRSERALALFATYFGRKVYPVHIEELLVAETRMADTDYVLGLRVGIGRYGLVSINGIGCEGFVVLDSSGGAPNFGMSRREAKSQRFRTLCPEALDISEAPL